MDVNLLYIERTRMILHSFAIFLTQCGRGTYDKTFDLRPKLVVTEMITEISTKIHIPDVILASGNLH